jgi:CRP/FNR family transcriptional regulator, anaerobic regulatory protein
MAQAVGTRQKTVAALPTGRPGKGSRTLAELCEVCTVRCLLVCRPMETADLAFVQRTTSGRHDFAQESDILRADARDCGPFTLWDGWAYSYRDLPEGKAGPQRQILDILLPGDLFRLGTALTGRTGSTVRTLTACTVCIHDSGAFSKLYTRRPELARGLVATMARDAERINARLTVIGQGTSVQRMAHLILEIWNRLAQRAQAPLTAVGGIRIPFPLQRRHLAAALGMSGNQAHRAFVELETQGLIRAEEGVMTILDAAGLAARCDFHPIPDEIGQRITL